MIKKVFYGNNNTENKEAKEEKLLRIQVREAPRKVVYYWLTREEAADKKLMNALKIQFKEWKEKNYLSVVFESGSENLEDNIYNLMKRNMELFAKKQEYIP